MNFEAQKTEKGNSSDQSPDLEEALRKKKYETTAEKLALIVEEVHSYHIPPQSFENWKDLGIIMSQIDDYLDARSSEERDLVIQALRQALETPDEVPEDLQEVGEEVLLLRKVCEGLEPENRVFFERLIKMLLDVTEAIKQTKDVKEAIRLTIVEGQISARLFIALLPTSFQEGEKYQEISHLLTRIGRIANVFDTASDLPKDFSENQIKVAPSVFNRLAFMAAALVEGARMRKKGLFTLKTVKMFTRSAYKILKDN